MQKSFAGILIKSCFPGPPNDYPRISFLRNYFILSNERTISMLEHDWRVAMVTRERAA